MSLEKMTIQELRREWALLVNKAGSVITACCDVVEAWGVLRRGGPIRYWISDEDALRVSVSYGETTVEYAGRKVFLHKDGSLQLFVAGGWENDLQSHSERAQKELRKRDEEREKQALLDRMLPREPDENLFGPYEEDLQKDDLPF